MKTKAILLLVVFTTIYSCKKEKSSTPAATTTAPASILGTWLWTEAYTPDGSGNYTVLLSPGGLPSGQTLTFVGDNTYNSNRSYADMGIPGAATNPDNGTYTNMDSLILTSNVTGKTVRAKVYKLTTNELWFRYNGNQNYELRFTK